MSRPEIPFNQPHIVGTELACVEEAFAHSRLSGNGPFTKKCQAWLSDHFGSPATFLTHSGTAALEMAALLAGIEPGDEIIMPSFTFVSTANAFVHLRGVPVFAEIRPDTLNLDPAAVEEAITERTRAIVPVHYGGVGCEMHELGEIARAHGLLLIEDAAHCLGTTYAGKPLGSFGDMAVLSFHDTKNVICGEGGALIVNNEAFAERAEIVWEKGTDRARFNRGEVDEYTWIDIGSSYLPSELNAAFLWAQLQELEPITLRRRSIWQRYHDGFEDLEKRGLLRRPVVPSKSVHNAHVYYLLLNSGAERNAFLETLRADGIHAVFHYVPLHSSPAGKRYGRAHGELAVSTDVARRLARLPLWTDLSEDQVQRVIDAVRAAVG